MKNENTFITPVRRKRLETQGYNGFMDAELNDFKFGIRFAYYLFCSLLVFGLLLTNLEILAAVMIIAFFGSLPPYHPFDYLYNYVIRHLAKSRPDQIRGLHVESRRFGWAELSISFITTLLFWDILPGAS